MKNFETEKLQFLNENGYLEEKDIISPYAYDYKPDPKYKKLDEYSYFNTESLSKWSTEDLRCLPILKMTENFETLNRISKSSSIVQ